MQASTHFLYTTVIRVVSLATGGSGGGGVTHQFRVVVEMFVISLRFNKHLKRVEFTGPGQKATHSN